MTTLKLASFIGEAPRLTPRLLPEAGAQIAQDVRLENGELSPFRKPFPIHEFVDPPAGGIKTIYRHASQWLAWGSIVHAAPGPVAADRLYFTGDGVPKMMFEGVTYPLAVQAPTAALTATVSGTGTGDAVTRLYVYTFVTEFGEESEPSPISAELLWKEGESVTLAGFQAAPAGRNITKQRIYRSQTGTSRGTQLFFIAERAASATDYVDTVPQEGIVEPLPSAYWNPPPDDLEGLISLPNGMMAAYKGKELYFCEPYRPHAWPESYVLTTDYDIMGLSAYGTTMVVATTGNPYIVSGTAPESMVMEKLELNMPCLSKQGMVDLGYSAAYPSHDGLVMVQSGAPSVATASLMTRDQWLKLKPAELVCGQFYGRYFASYSYTDTDGSEQNGTLIVDLTGANPFIIRSRHRADAFFYDLTSGALFMAMEGVVYEWDSRLAANDTYTWRSKAFVTPQPTSFGALLFEVDQRKDLDAVIAFESEVERIHLANAAIFAQGDLQGALNEAPIGSFALNGDTLIPIPDGMKASVNVYADGKFLATVGRAGRMERLPSGRLAREWELEVVGNVAVIEVTMATTGQELRGV